MKDLNKKIGAGVLVLGLVIGGLGLSGGLVSHADSVGVQGQVDEDPFDGIDLGEIDENEFLKEFEKMLEKASIEFEKVDGKIIKAVAHFK